MDLEAQQAAQAVAEAQRKLKAEQACHSVVFDISIIHSVYVQETLRRVQQEQSSFLLQAQREQEERERAYQEERERREREILEAEMQKQAAAAGIFAFMLRRPV